MSAKKQAREGYDVNKSMVSDDRLAQFLQTDLQEDLKSVPGIGPKAVEKLAADVDGDEGVRTTYQLVGKFLCLRGPGMTPKEHKDAFWHYLDQRGVDSHRSGVVRCISEKTYLLIPGMGAADE